MRNTIHHLKDNHILWGLKIVPRRKIRPTSSTQLPTIPPVQIGLPRFEILPTESHSSLTDDFVHEPEQVLEILPTHPNSSWNTESLQKFSIGRAWQEDNAVEHALRFFPPDPEEGKVIRLSSPFEGFELDPNHQDGLNFEPTTDPRCEQLLESPDPEYANKYEKVCQGPSNRPGTATPPYKRHVLYRYNRSSILPVPDHYEPGPVRKVNWTRFSPSQEKHFFDLDRQNRAVDIIKAKQIYEAFRNQSIAHGNSYYLEWEARQHDLRRNIENSYKWDLATQNYFSELHDYDLGRIPDRPKPILLIGESVTHLLRSGAETPIPDYDIDPLDDETNYPDPPEPPLPFWGLQVRPHLWALRAQNPPRFVPGGYLFHVTDVRAECGQVYYAREMEFAPLTQFQPPAIDTPGSPIQEGVMSGIFTNILQPPPEWVTFEGEREEEAVLWPSDAHFQIERKQAKGLPLSNDNMELDKETEKQIRQMNKNPSDILAEELEWGRGISDDFFITAFGQILFAQAYPGMSDSYRDQFRSAGVEPYGKNEEGLGTNYNVTPRVRENREPIRVNPYRSLANRRDWYYWFVRRRRILKWLYVIRQKMVLNEANYDSVELTFFEVLCEWYKWKPPPVKTLPPNKTKIAVLQLNCSEDKDDNIATVLQFLKVAAGKHASMVFLPECFDFVGSSREETLELSESVTDGYIIRRYQDLAKQFGMWMSLGGFHEKSEDELRPDGLPWIRNSHLLLNPDGEIVSLYRKIHLFDVDIPEKGLALTESSYVLPGSELVLSPTTPIGRIGLGVCYDLRFPEFGMTYRAQGAHVLTYPSAFTIHTGKVHWEALIRTRAIENQCFVIAAAQAGEHNAKRSSYGHSMIVDPWGTILTQAEGSGPGIIFAEIDLAHLEKVRKEMPVISHKVPGIASILANVNSTTTTGSERSDTFAVVETPQVTNIPSGPSCSRVNCTVPDSAQDDLQFFFGPIVAKYEIVFLENSTARAFVNRKCVVPGHVLVSTKRVAHRLQDLSEDEISGLFLLVQKVEQVMESVNGVTSSTITVQDGKESGQTVEHVHVHVLPRRSCDFEDNDSVYQKLATHDKGPAIVWRQPEAMKEEAASLRAYIHTNFPQFLSNPELNTEPINDQV